MKRTITNTRSCIVCRSMKEKPELLRLINYNDTTMFDLTQKIQQRGFYVCYEKKCISALKNRKNRRSVSSDFDLELNLERLENYLLQKIKKLITLSFVKKKVIIGVDAVVSYSKKSIIFLASDIAENSEKSLKNSDKKYLKLPLDRFDLGKMVRKGEVVSIGVTSVDTNFKNDISHYTKIFSKES